MDLKTCKFEAFIYVTNTVECELCQAQFSMFYNIYLFSVVLLMPHDVVNTVTPILKMIKLRHKKVFLPKVT